MFHNLAIKANASGMMRWMSSVIFLCPYDESTFCLSNIYVDLSWLCVRLLPGNLNLKWLLSHDLEWSDFLRLHLTGTFVGWRIILPTYLHKISNPFVNGSQCLFTLSSRIILSRQHYRSDAPTVWESLWYQTIIKRLELHKRTCWKMVHTPGILYTDDQIFHTPSSLLYIETCIIKCIFSTNLNACVFSTMFTPLACFI